MPKGQAFCPPTAAVIALLACVAGLTPCFAKSLPGPREALTFRDSGLYGGWNEYFLSPECPFDFFIIQAWVGDDSDASWHGKEGHSSWNGWLRRARRAGKRVIADIFFWGGKDANTETYKRRLDRFLTHVDVDKLYAITLSEENIYWDGHQEILKDLCHYVKGKYDVPVWQWYSPYAGVPGFGWPHLPADGWGIDEYARRGDTFEPFIRRYVIHQLPLFQIIWAAPAMKDFDWEKSGKVAFEEQIMLCRRYNVPCAFFCWEGRGNIWGWSTDASPEAKAVFARCVEHAEAARDVLREDVGFDWDEVPAAPPVTMRVNEDRTVTYEDPVDTAPRFMDHATIKGFANLRWDGGPLEALPRKPGPAYAELTYHLTSPFPVHDIEATATLQGRPALGERVVLGLSADGKHWQRALWPTAPMKGTDWEDQRVSLRVGGLPGFDDIAELWVRIGLRSTNETGEAPIVRLRNLRVQGVCTPPENREILLMPDADGKAAYRDGTTSGALRFTAEFDNPEQLEWLDGAIGTHGLEGYGNEVAVRQKFVCDRPLKLLRIATQNWANAPDLGSANRVAISLDGKEKLVERETEGRFSGPLELRLDGDARFCAVREFWVHLEMRNGSGAKTGTSNRISGLEVEAQAAE